LHIPQRRIRKNLRTIETAFLLSSKNFKELEKLAQEYRVNKSRTPGGTDAKL
jgi:hypothetical protein